MSKVDIDNSLVGAIEIGYTRDEISRLCSPDERCDGISCAECPIRQTVTLMRLEELKR